MLQTDAPAQRKELIMSAKAKLAEKGIEVTEEDLQSALKMIAVGTAKNTKLKWAVKKLKSNT